MAQTYLQLIASAHPITCPSALPSDVIHMPRVGSRVRFTSEPDTISIQSESKLAQQVAGVEAIRLSWDVVFARCFSRAETSHDGEKMQKLSQTMTIRLLLLEGSPSLPGSTFEKLQAFVEWALTASRQWWHLAAGLTLCTFAKVSEEHLVLVAGTRGRVLISAMLQDSALRRAALDFFNAALTPPSTPLSKRAFITLMCDVDEQLGQGKEQKDPLRILQRHVESERGRMRVAGADVLVDLVYYVNAFETSSSAEREERDLIVAWFAMSGGEPDGSLDFLRRILLQGPALFMRQHKALFDSLGMDAVCKTLCRSAEVNTFFMIGMLASRDKNSPLFDALCNAAISSQNIGLKTRTWVVFQQLVWHRRMRGTKSMVTLLFMRSWMGSKVGLQASVNMIDRIFFWVFNRMYSIINC